MHLAASPGFCFICKIGAPCDIFKDMHLSGICGKMDSELLSDVKSVQRRRNIIECYYLVALDHTDRTGRISFSQYPVYTF